MGEGRPAIYWLCGVCWAPFVLVGAMVLIGWGEKRAVCRAKAIDQGRDLAVEVGCSDVSEGAGELVHFNCDLQQTGLQPAELTVNDNLFDVSFAGTCLKTTSNMMQCVETKHEDDSRRRRSDSSTSSGSSTYYTYSKSWTEDTSSGSSGFHDTDAAYSACQVNSPAPWDSYVLASNTRYANSVKAGAWTINDGLDSISCDTALESSAASLKAGNWEWSDQGSVFTRGSGNTIGDYRVSFSGNDWNNPGVTGLGKNTNGVLEDWTADSDWLCSGEILYEVRPGSQDVDELFSDLESENTALTWILRAVGFLLFWLGFVCCLGPFVFVAEMADYIPCVGDFISDSLKTIIYAVACLPACACCLLVTAISWVAMRPLLGVPCLLVSCCCFCAFGGILAYKRKPKEAKVHVAGP